MSFKKGLLIYAFILLVIIAIIDAFVTVKLVNYERLMKQKDNKDLIVIASPSVTADPTVTVAPSPSPVPAKTVTFEIPEGLELYVDGQAIDYMSLETEKVKAPRFDVLYDFSGKYKEYANLEEEAKIPSLVKFCLEIKGDSEVGIYTKDLKTVATDYKEETATYSCGFIHNEEEKEEITGLAAEIQKSTALFYTDDLSKDKLAKYFPDNSEYFKYIVDKNYKEGTGHKKPPEFTNLRVNAYEKYSDSLYYTDITVTQTMLANDGKEYVIDINHKIWLYKTEKGLRIAAIEF